MRKRRDKAYKKALSQNVYFDAESVAALSEFVDTKTLETLLPLVKEPFTQAQISHIEDYSMLTTDEIKSFMKTSISFANISWKDYYDAFYNMSGSDKISASKQINDFPNKDEVIEVILDLAGIEGSTEFILNALRSGIKLNAEQLEEIIYWADKDLNKHVIFDNLDTFKAYMPTENFIYFENLLHQEDFIKLKRKVGYIDPVYKKPKKIGIMAQIGVAQMMIDFWDHIFRRKEDD